MKIYDEEKSNEDVIQFVKSHVKSVKTSKNDRFHTILSMIPRGDKQILDYGCGWGYYSIAMEEMGNTIEAIDISQNEIDICNLV